MRYQLKRFMEDGQLMWELYDYHKMEAINCYSDLGKATADLVLYNTGLKEVTS